MTNKELIALLTKCKDTAEFGGGIGVSHTQQAWSRLAREIGLDEQLARPHYRMRDYLEYASWKLSHVWLQPMTVALSAFALIFGGWIATVNASFDSIPGDILYPVKLVTERVQITLALSGEQRAKLHAEFAGRRLDELNTITSSDVEGKEIRYKAAAEGFKQEIASVNVELASVDPEQAVELAILVDQKTDEYEAAIAQSESDAPEENKGDAADVRTVVEESNAQAINTIVQSHEANQRPQTEESLQKNFQAKLKELDTRVALSLGRLTVIEAALGSKGLTDPSYAKRVDDAKSLVVSYEGEIQEAMNTFAAGGYRAAFDQLALVETEVAHSEEIITELEIELTTGL